jgi:hypothetical protein
MMPNRPIWLSRHETINRDALFANFRGLLTYGSPLERFCALWSSMVPINMKEDPFPHGAEWVNVYDPTDPVGTWISDFDPISIPRPNHAVLTPHNFPCRASPIVLFSHICYLNKSRLRSLRLTSDSQHLLVNQVAHWLVEGGSLAVDIAAAPTGSRTFWMPRTAGGAGPGWPVYGRAIWRYVQWISVGGILTVLTLASLHRVIFPLVTLVKGIIFPHVEGVLRWLGFTIF